jgi:hypothetical protein
VYDSYGLAVRSFDINPGSNLQKILTESCIMFNPSPVLPIKKPA